MIAAMQAPPPLAAEADTDMHVSMRLVSLPSISSNTIPKHTMCLYIPDVSMNFIYTPNVDMYIPHVSMHLCLHTMQQCSYFDIVPDCVVLRQLLALYSPL